MKSIPPVTLSILGVGMDKNYESRTSQWQKRRLSLKALYKRLFVRTNNVSHHTLDVIFGETWNISSSKTAYIFLTLVVKMLDAMDVVVR